MGLAPVGCRGSAGVLDKGPGVSSFLLQGWEEAEGFMGPGRLACPVMSCPWPALLFCWGGGGGCAGKWGGTAQSSLFIWGNVWYVWYLGVYFPGCSWVPGVEICLMQGEEPSGPGQSWI